MGLQAEAIKLPVDERLKLPLCRTRPVIHLRAYHSSFSVASKRDCTGRSVISFQSILFSVLRCPAISGMGHSEHQRQKAFLLSDRWLNSNPPILDLENSFVRFAIVVSDVDAMQRL